MRFTPTGPDTSLDQTKARLSNYQEHQTTHGFSKWIILDRRLGCAIGDSGLLELREYACIDLGFRLVQRYWGKGLATEAASAWVHAAFHDLHLDRLTALVHPENYPSIRILEKLGFHLEKRDTVMGMNSIPFSAPFSWGTQKRGLLLPKRAAAFWEGTNDLWEEPGKQKTRSCRTQELA